MWGFVAMAEKNRRISSDNWRLPVLVLITAAAAGLGFHLKSAADPGTESKQFASKPPLDLDFYVSNPHMSLSLQLFIRQGKRSDVAEVFVEATVPDHETGEILTLSNIPDGEGQLHRLTPAPDANRGHISRPYNGYYGNVLRKVETISSEIENNFAIEQFNFTIAKVTESTDASFYGHLPSVNSLYEAVVYQDVAPCIAGEFNSSGKLSHIVIDPYGTECLFGPDYDVKGMYYPIKVSTAEILPEVGPEFKTDEVNYINPPGNIDGDSYVWQSNSTLEPIFKLTDQDAVQTESDNGFLAGIFFGVAGGAAIAVVQEAKKRSRGPTLKYTKPLAYFFMRRLSIREDVASCVTARCSLVFRPDHTKSAQPYRNPRTAHSYYIHAAVRHSAYSASSTLTARSAAFGTRWP